MKLLVHIPWPVNCAVIIGTPVVAEVASALEWINPFLQACAYLVAILWGVVQMGLAWRNRR